MSSSSISPSAEAVPQPTAEKTELTAITSPVGEKYVGADHLHLVPRTEVLPEYDDSQSQITGYDPTLMRARATLSSDEEKKLIRRIDWHLLPLLAVMYMVKTIDASNVQYLSCFALMLPGLGCSLLYQQTGFKRAHHGPRHTQEYYD